MYDFHARAPCEDWEAPHVVQPPTGTPRWHPARGSAALTQVSVHLVKSRDVSAGAATRARRGGGVQRCRGAALSGSGQRLRSRPSPTSLCRGGFAGRSTRNGGTPEWPLDRIVVATSGLRGSTKPITRTM